MWHRRMGLPSSKVVELLPIIGERKNKGDLVSCDVCFRTKQTRDVFVSSSNKAENCFDLIHCDLWGSYRVPASFGARYFLTIVNDCSRGVWIYLLNGKDEAPLALRRFFAMIKRQFDKEVKIVRSENGTKFTCLTDYFAENGILHETSCVRTPEQNERVERKHRHILNVARALRFQANLPMEFWGEYS